MKKNCRNCAHFSAESDGDYGEIFCGYYCSEKPHVAYLTSFPFQKEMPCFKPDFWLTMMHDPEMNRLHDEDMRMERQEQEWESWKYFNAKYVTPAAV
ncbi:hypothetical protein [Larkinella soli]|uniref:hypothetical protein n=1 Tax=Larkinella soli TaxID=1770527 RepID=UPI0013E2B296|nr:hypothetical protein [Larkinella soli]